MPYDTTFVNSSLPEFRSAKRMAPSSLKKMRGGRIGREGNDASFVESAKGRSLCNDLGLTLLPGSQILKEDDRDIRATKSRGQQHDISEEPQGCRRRGWQRIGERLETSAKSALPKDDHPSSPQGGRQRVRTVSTVSELTRKHLDNSNNQNGNCSLKSSSSGVSKDASRESTPSPLRGVDLQAMAELSQTLGQDIFATENVLPPAPERKKPGLGALAPPKDHFGRIDRNSPVAPQTSHIYKRLTKLPVESPSNMTLNPRYLQSRMIQAPHDLSMDLAGKASGQVSRSWTKHFPPIVKNSGSGCSTSHPISPDSLVAEASSHTQQFPVCKLAHSSPPLCQHIREKETVIARSQIPSLRLPSAPRHCSSSMDLKHLPELSKRASVNSKSNPSPCHFLHRSQSLPNISLAVQTTTMASLPTRYELLKAPCKMQHLANSDGTHDRLADHGHEEFDHQLQQKLLPTHYQSPTVTQVDANIIKSPSEDHLGDIRSTVRETAETAAFVMHTDHHCVLESPTLQEAAMTALLGSTASSEQVPKNGVRKMHVLAEKKIQELQDQLQTIQRDFQALSSTHRRLEDAYRKQEVQQIAIRTRATKAERANRALQKQVASSQKTSTSMAAKYDGLVKKLQDQMEATCGPDLQLYSSADMPNTIESDSAIDCQQHGVHQIFDILPAAEGTMPFAGNGLDNPFDFPSSIQEHSAICTTPDMRGCNDGSLFGNLGIQTGATSLTPTDDAVLAARDMTFNDLGASLDAIFGDEQLEAAFGKHPTDWAGCGATTGFHEQAVDLTKDSPPSRNSSMHSARFSRRSRRSSAHARNASIGEVEKKERKKLANQSYRENRSHKRKLSALLGEDSEEYKREVAKLKTATGRESRAGNSPKTARSRSQVVTEIGEMGQGGQVVECGSHGAAAAGGFDGMRLLDFDEAGNASITEGVEFDEAGFAAALEAEMMRM